MTRRNKTVLQAIQELKVEIYKLRYTLWEVKDKARENLRKLNLWLRGYRCDKCWRLATSFKRELVEDVPVKDEAGDLWATWKATGKESYGCSKHPSEEWWKDG